MQATIELSNCLSIELDESDDILSDVILSAWNRINHSKNAFQQAPQHSPLHPEVGLIAWSKKRQSKLHYGGRPQVIHRN